MVTKVNNTLSSALLNSRASLERDLIVGTLLAFSIERLLHNKLISRNFKAGLDFTDPNRSRYSRQKLIDLLVVRFQKDNPHMVEKPAAQRANANPTTDPVLPNELYENFILPYLYKGYDGMGIGLSVQNDPVVARYRRMLSYRADQLGLNLDIFHSTNYQPGIDDRYIYLEVIPKSRNWPPHESYRWLLFLSDFTKILKTLSRKALFRDENVRVQNRSRFTQIGADGRVRRGPDHSATRPDTVETTDESRRAELVA